MDNLDEELGTVGEVSDLLGVTRQRVHQLMSEGDDPLPQPVLSKSNGKIQLWDMRETRRWAKRNSYPKAPRPSAATTS